MTGRRPGETAEYREARDALLEAEHELTRAAENVARLRRSMPLGGTVPEDYVFTEGPRNIDETGPLRPVTMTELFGGHPTLLLYSFMFDGTGTPCRMCTSLIDGYEGAAADLERRVGFAVVAPAPADELRAYGRQRGWRNVRLVSALGNAYSNDYGGVDSDGSLTSRMNVFSRRDGTVRHFYATEKPATGSDQDDRHLDTLWTLWGALDLSPEGRGDWRPERPPRR